MNYNAGPGYFCQNIEGIETEWCLLLFDTPQNEADKINRI